MNNTTTTTFTAFKIGKNVKWKSGAAGAMTTKKGLIIAKIAAGKAIPANKFPALAKKLAAKTKNVRFVVNVKGKLYCPRTTALQLV